jgi:hypothetical protein
VTPLPRYTQDVQAPAKLPFSFSRSLASLLGAPMIAFVAFIAGLAATSLVMSAWNSDVVYVLCFGLAFLGGLFVTNRLSRSLASEGESIAEGVVVSALLGYAVTVVLLSLVLVGIIHELRAS